ncbi:unnamed protein product [Brugia timori]|uniref:Exostosin domain-containing protein n=1 Tax=Brugia timori TaxID=42155 RepID=A0A0R3R966_9BILA|nr:unnamed protein product [Brugia timori]
MIMSNSTFCLTPRGRRLGSFRFLEALRLGCIPVVLSDDWELPFSEVIDWRQAVIIGHEDTVLTISDVLNAIPLDRILFMKQQSRGLYQRYFSSVEKITLTALQIIEERINKQRGEEPRNWNRLFLPVENSPTSASSNENGYTVLLRASIKVSGRLNRIVNLFCGIHEVRKIIILWPKNRQMKTNFDSCGANIFVQPSDFDVHVDILSQAQALQAEFVGAFILFLDERVPITVDDIRFLVDAASTEPYRLYGFYAANSKVEGGMPTVELKPSSEYSLILFHLALIKREYLLYFEQWMPTPAKGIALKVSHCFTLLMNMMVAELTGQSPVLIGSRIHDKWMLTRNYSECLDKLVTDVWPSGASLISSQAKINPLLYKDDISSSRKKYAGMEYDIL